MSTAWIALLASLGTGALTLAGVLVTARVSKRSTDLAAENQKRETDNRATELAQEAARIVGEAYKDARTIDTQVLSGLMGEVERLSKSVQDLRDELTEVNDRASRLEEALHVSERNFQTSQRNVETLRRELIKAGIEVPQLEPIEVRIE